MDSSWRCAIPIALFVLAACATARPVPPEQVEAAEERLLAPFMQPRAVVSDRLEIEISANFDHLVARPATSPEIHEFSRAQDGEDAVYRWSSRGGLQSPLKFFIGNTQFAALRSATLRVRGGRADLALTATATGTVTEGESGKELRAWREIRVADGVLRRQ